MFEDHFLQIIQSWGTLLAAAGAGVFGWKQYQINKRLQKLSDFVAISIVPFALDNAPKIQIRNVGRINLYLHRWEIDGSNETYGKSRLLACGPELFFVIPVPDILGLEMPMKMYLTDEHGQKYISTGTVVIDPQPVSITIPQAQDSTPQQLQAVQQLMMRRNVRAWSYKTQKYNWVI